MQITAVETSVVSLPFDMGGPHPTFAGRPWDKLEILLVRVQTDDGRVGWGEAFGHAGIPATKAALDTVVAPLVLGRDPGDLVGLQRQILHATHLLGRNGPFTYAFAGVEIALWDLLGKRTGQPIWRLLGGTKRERLPAYASLLPYGGDCDLVARNTRAAYDQGYRRIKLHELTLDAVRAARAAAADAEIMLDVNCAWSPQEARDHAAALRPENLFWLEEPVWPPEDVASLASVRRLGIPIAAGENTAGLFGFRALIEAGAVDFIQPSVTKLGGILEMQRIITLAQAHGVEVMPHSPYFGPGFLATLHVAAALLERPSIEVLWLDMEANPFDPWVRAQDGHVRVPDGPGLGCDPDPTILARYASAGSTRVAT